jgi:subtilisin family serine protease
MKLIFLLLLLSIPCFAVQKQLRVAIVDTGLDLKDPRFTHLCPTGHKNFVKSETLDDINGHGTHVSGLIELHAGKSNYCMLIYKFYSDSISGSSTTKNEVGAIREAIEDGADVINLSEDGPEFDEDEAIIIKYHPEVTFVVAAGNERKDLDIQGNQMYPASLNYPNIVVVGSLDHNAKRSEYSNYGKKVENWEVGEQVWSYLPNGKYGFMSGTSMSTAIATGKLVDKLSKKGNNGVNNASQH